MSLALLSQKTGYGGYGKGRRPSDGQQAPEEYVCPITQVRCALDGLLATEADHQSILVTLKQLAACLQLLRDLFRVVLIFGQPSGCTCICRIAAADWSYTSDTSRMFSIRMRAGGDEGALHGSRWPHLRASGHHAVVHPLASHVASCPLHPNIAVLPWL